MNEEQVYYNILKLLDKYASKRGLSKYLLAPVDYLNNLDITEEQLNTSIDFLEEEGYIIVDKSVGSHFRSTGLTSKGKKKLMQSSSFYTEQPNAINIQGNKNIIASSNITITNNYNSFNETIDKLELDETTKQMIKSYVKDLIDDISNNQANETKIKKFFKDTIAATGKTMAPVIFTEFTKMFLK